ncbi:Fic family protein [Microbacterium sp.]|uniref:Fic family protein n=1 Tax=Microbacterium sp. TaxID=51671 RepID=UPI0039E2F5E4
MALGAHVGLDSTLGIAVHAETVRVHPFVDGNGRSTRLLVFFAAQPDDAPIEEYDWVIDKGEYLRLLREHQVTRDPVPLAAFIPVRPFGCHLHRDA